MEFLQNMAKKNSTAANQLVKPVVGNAKIMSTADDISLWYDAIQLYEAGLVEEALDIFMNKVKQNAKMIINAGCCYLRKNDLKTAADIFERAVTQDKHMALGYYYLGLTHFFLKNNKVALEAFEKTFDLLRGNRFVDYRQLGYNYQLYACEVLTNIAAACTRLSEFDKAKDILKQASGMKTEKKHEMITEIIQNFENGKLFKPFVPPQSELFRPSKAAVANIQKKNYLGTAKVISTDSEKDCYACFSGIKDKVIEKKDKERRIPTHGIELTTSDHKTSNPRRKSSTLPPLFPISPDVQFDAVDGSPVMERKSIAPVQPLPVGPNSPKAERRAYEDNVFVEDNALRNRRATVTGVMPNKPLPKLDNATFSVEAKLPTLQCEPPTPQEDMIEVEILYTFTKKVLLPRSCTLYDLHLAATSQAVPEKVEFRTSDALGRQSVVTEDRLKELSIDICNNNNNAPIQCFPAP